MRRCSGGQGRRLFSYQLVFFALATSCSSPQRHFAEGSGGDPETAGGSSESGGASSGGAQDGMGTDQAGFGATSAGAADNGPAGAASGGAASGGAGGAAPCVSTDPHASSACNAGDVWWLSNCQTPSTKKLDCCGQGCSAGACNPPVSHASTVCYAGDEYWADSCGNVGVMKKSCCNVGCMNNQCKAINPQASKTCVGGNSFWVDSCGTTGQAAQDCAGNGCQNGACLPACPSDMVSIGSSAYCIDRYEDSVWSASTCTGVSYFASLGNFPAGYPALVSSSGLTGTVTVGGDSYTLSAPTTTLYACSKPGVLPAQNITYFQAKRACENAGKRLCSLTEQQTACGAVYPYGGTYSATACNGVDAGKGAAVATGSFPGCQGSVSGLFDMAGNVSEWTQCDAQSCFQSSGTFESPQSVLKCSYYSGEFASNDGGGQGFRCCKDR